VGGADAGRPRGLCSTRTPHRSRPPVGRLSRRPYAMGDSLERSEKLFGWDRAEVGVGRRVPTLSERLPVDLRGAASRPDFDALPFRSLYLLDDEWAAEIANQTVHGVLHLGWVSDGLAAIAGRWPFS
jgi:hypothetical protein